MLDYNEEARKLFASLDGSKPSRFNNLDPIYRSEAGGFIYVGGDLVGWQKYLMMLIVETVPFRLPETCKVYRTEVLQRWSTAPPT